MKDTILNNFIRNYILMFFISIIIALLSIMLLSFSGDIISKNLIKNHYTAESIMVDDYQNMDVSNVIENGGGVQVINRDFKIVYSAGLDTFINDQLTIEEFTDFLIKSKSIGIPYSYDITYNSKEQFWLLVTFPTSIRIDIDIAHNKEYSSVDAQKVVGVLLAITLFYLILLGISTVIYSKLTSFSVINPLKKLSKSTQRLKDGDYTARVDLNLKNEFKELQDTFNSMAEKLEKETALRIQAEENRKRLVLDVSHDLKNPLASIMGYAELCKNTPNLSKEKYNTYAKIIYDNSLRANNLITDLFELSKMESSEYTLNISRVDLCEYLREEMSTALPTFEQCGLFYEFNIPEEELIVQIDETQMNRVFQNLIDNVVKYNPSKTKVTVSLLKLDKEALIIFQDDGIGISKEIAEDIFDPFVRVDRARNSESGGTGLGLAIVFKIIEAHGGTIHLITDINSGCKFMLRLPII